MTNPVTTITDHLDTWSSAIKAKSSAGRGGGKKQEFYGIKKLRVLILELAVRGLLVPQDAEDEPASELLKKIRAEEARLLKDGEIKKGSHSPDIKESEMPFALPSGWNWIRLAEAGHDWGQKAPDSDFTYIDVGAINKEQGLVSDPTILPAGDAPSRARKIVKKGTVIYSTVRPYLLNIAVVSESFEPEPIASTAFAIIHPFQGIEASFVYRYLRSPTFIQYVESCQTGIAYPAINDKQFFAGLLPLPPLAEQHRIVAKVDELMALCDQLEQQQEDSVSTHASLVETLLGALTSASERGALTEAWQRIAAHFDTLFTTESSIDQLKQTILHLAVMGKLVAQDPGDEPVKKLLKQILVERRKLQRTKATVVHAMPPVDALAYDIPKSWVWQLLDDLLIFGPTNGFSPQAVSYETPVRSLTLSATTSGQFKGEYSKFITTEVPPDSELWLRNGDILVQRGNSMEYVGVAAVYRGESNCFIYPDLMMKLRVSTVLNVDFIYLAMSQQPARNFLRARASGTSGSMPKINQATLKALPIPIPPLAEQRRIVAKVDELMTLCDNLQAKIQTAQATQLHLADSLVDAAIH